MLPLLGGRVPGTFINRSVSLGLVTNLVGFAFSSSPLLQKKAALQKEFAFFLHFEQLKVADEYPKKK